jgi:CRP-like cAMP-binding protein
MTTLPAVRLADLEKIPLFKGVTPGDLDRLVGAAHQKHVRAGEFFFMQNDPAERMFVLLKGRVRLSQAGVDGQQVLIRVITPVTLFALVAITSTASYLVTAQAGEDSQAIYWTRPELALFSKVIPQLALNATGIMAERLNEIQERFREVTTERVEERLAHTLIRLAGQSGRSVAEGILIDMKITRQDLAEMSGTTLFTTSRVLNAWQAQGHLQIGRQKIIIRDPYSLARIAGEDAG